jgi:hypothetical protein
MFKPVARAADGEGRTGGDMRIGLSFFIEGTRASRSSHSGSRAASCLTSTCIASRTACVIAYNTEVRSKAEGEITRKVDAEILDVMLKEVIGAGK